MEGFDTFTWIAAIHAVSIGGAILLYPHSVDLRPAYTVLYGVGFVFTVVHGQHLYGWWV